jgi:hypothetical protein
MVDSRKTLYLCYMEDGKLFTSVNQAQRHIHIMQDKTRVDSIGKQERAVRTVQQTEGPTWSYRDLLPAGSLVLLFTALNTVVKVWSTGT